MFEYTNSFLKPFTWAKVIYENNFDLSSIDKVDVTQTNLISPTLPSFSNIDVTIRTDSDWNNTSKKLVATFGALFTTVDKADSYIDGLYTLVNSRLSESESRIKELENSLRVLSTYQQRGASTAINIKGGDYSSIDFNKKYYKTSPPLNSNVEEGVFKLRDTGYFSSIRSLGGFAGTATVEKSLLSYIESGQLSSINDGSRSTFWTALAYAPGPVKSDSSQVPWLPADYQYGFALLLSYYLDRPTLATEVFIDPLVTEPLDLLSISWAPEVQSNVISSLISTSGWTLNGSASYVNSGSVNSSSLLVNLSTTGSGWASYTFTIPLITSNVSGVATLKSNRAQLSYLTRGLGDVKTGHKLLWLDSAGEIINYSRDESQPTSFWAGRSSIDYIPINAVSGRVELGVFNNTAAPASGWFDYPVLYIGDEVFNCNYRITGPTTIQLPKPVLSGRFTFTFSQRNIRKEVLAKTTNAAIQPIEADPELDPTLQKMLNKITTQFSSAGKGDNVFGYRIGLKELDLRYREHIPRGSLVSLPLKTAGEIRNIWVTAELGKYHTSGIKFKIYPFENDLEKSTIISPWLIGNSTNNSANGEYLYIYSTEEVASGWYNPLDKYYVVPERKIVEEFDGTNREGKIRLSNAPHLRRPKIKAQLSWLERYSVWPAILDPNAATLYGFSSSTLKDAIRSNAVPSGTIISDILNTDGYIPTKVTISTDKWTAYPDTLGRPDVSKVRQILGENLVDISSGSETQQSEVVSDDVGFSNWLNTTTSKQIIALCPGQLEGYGLSLIMASNIRMDALNNKPRTLKQIISYNMVIEFLRRQELKVLYNRLLAEGKIGLNSTKTTTNIFTIPQNSVFATKFAPVIVGPGGTFLKLYWYNSSATGGILPISRADYEVLDSNTGRIKILKDGPEGFTDVLADYLYISNSQTEDFFSTVLGSINTSSATTSAIASQAEVITRTFPITRNMTDYVTGKVPKLRVPNFTRLSADYYPIIEYYVNSDGELIFARDFYRFGDTPAQIKVEYETLGISPRLGIEVTRQGTVATTPIIKNISLRVKESLSTPMREVE